MKKKCPQSQLKHEKVTCFVDLDENLLDLRNGRRYFGKVKDICKQYGVSIEKNGVFSAPLGRLKYFIEKLHFAGKRYFQ